MSVYLKIKIMSLAAEAGIIRREELRWKTRGRSVPMSGLGAEIAAAWLQSSEQARDQCASLHHHRVQIVRREARSSQLAYGFLRGRDYRSMEAKAFDKPDHARIAAIAKRFCKGSATNVTPDAVKAWAGAVPAE